MRSIIFISLLGLAFAGCTALTAPAPPSAPSDLTSYFWPAKDTTLSYLADSVKHTIALSSTGSVSDAGPFSAATPLGVQKTASSISIGGLSASDIFAFDPEIQIVSQTTPIIIKNSVSIRSIAAVEFHLYLASSSDLYLYISDTQLQNLGPLPANNVKLISSPFNDVLYAVEFGGDKVYYSAAKSSADIHWKTVSGNGAISAFVPQNERGPGSAHAEFLTASGGQIFHYDDDMGSIVADPLKAPILPGTITAMQWLPAGFGAPQGILAGLKEGTIYNLNMPDHRPIDSSTIANLGPGATINSVAEFFAGCNTGVYDGFSGWLQIDPSPVMSLLDAGNSTIFAAMASGEVAGFSRFNYVHASFGSPGGSIAATQLAMTQTRLGGRTLSELYALVGSTVYAHSADTASLSNWTVSNLTTSGSTLWPAGSFVLLANGPSQWSAGYALRTDQGTPKVFTYTAASGPSSTVVLDGISYTDVVTVTYVASDGIAAEASLVPKYLIYYQRGFGPIRIEKTENSQTTVTRLVK